MKPGDDRQQGRTWQEWLQHGDPAADGSEPTADELQRWRRQALAALPRPHQRRRRGLVPVTVSLAAVAMVMLILVAVRPDASGQRAALPAAVTASAGDGGPLPTSDTGPGRETTLPLPGRDEAHAESLVLPGTEKPATSVAEALPANKDRGEAQPASAGKRVVHFTAPGGTRVIWTLNPSFHAPSSGGQL